MKQDRNCTSSQERLGINATAHQPREASRSEFRFVYDTGGNEIDLFRGTGRIVHSEDVFTTSESRLLGTSWDSQCAVLLDHYFVLSKPEDKNGVTSHRIRSRPIILDFLLLVTFSDPPVPPVATGLSRIILGNPETSSSLIYPFTLRDESTGEDVILYSKSEKGRFEWESALNEAVSAHKAYRERTKVFDVNTLNSETFYNGHPNDEHPFTGEVLCAVPLTTADGREMIAFGCAEGVWVGPQDDPKSLLLALPIKGVTQCAAINDIGLFLILANKALLAYRIEDLVAGTPNTQKCEPERLSGNKDVSLFRYGQLGDHKLVVYVIISNLDSIFHVLKPVASGVNQPQLSSRFTEHRKFFLPSICHDISFLKTKLALLLQTSLDILDIDSLTTTAIPGPDVQTSLNRQVGKGRRPLALHRIGDEFLSSYDNVGIYVDRHGDAAREQFFVRWEGTAESVAYYHPHTLLFNRRYIEVRTAKTGELVQVIQGKNIRCLTKEVRGFAEHGNSGSGLRLYVAMSAVDNVGFDCVFELVHAQPPPYDD